MSWESMSDQDRAAVFEHQAASRAIHEQRWARTVPPHFVDARLSDFPDVPRLGEWAGLPGPTNLLLVGSPGTGKTRAAVAVARARFDAGNRVEFLTVADLLDGLRPDGGVDFAGLVGADLLVLDDVGAEKASEWTVQEIDRLVNKRYAEDRPVVVTSNMGPDRLHRHVGERVWSRWAEDRVVLTMTGRDRRP